MLCIVVDCYSFFVELSRAGKGGACSEMEEDEEEEEAVVRVSESGR